MANQVIKNKTLNELLESLRQNSLYERNGQPRYFDAPVGNAVGAMEGNHTRLKTRIGADGADGHPINYDYANQIQNNAINPVGSLTWDALIAGAGAGLIAGAGAFTINDAQLNDEIGGGGARQRAVDVIDNSRLLPPSAAAAGTVSNNHIIARIRQEIAAGANDARIRELIGVMQNPHGNANPNGDQANEILYAIKINLGGELNNNIIGPIITQLDAKIAELNQRHNSAAKRDVAALEQIKKDVTSAKFNRNFVDNISKFKKSLDILERVHTKMQTYNTAVPNIDNAVGAIEIYDALLRNGDSTRQDIDTAYNDAYNQLSSNTRSECYLDELIESRENYFAQLKLHDAVKIAQKNALEVTQHLHPEKNTAKAVGVSVIGVTLAAATTALLTLELGTQVPAAAASVHWNPSTGASVTIPANQADFKPPSHSEGICIAVVCILILAATAYIAYHYASQAIEEKDLDLSSNKSLVNVDDIDTDKSQSQIKAKRNEVAVVDLNIKKRLINPEQPSFRRE